MFNRKKYGRFMAACLATMLAFSPVAATEGLMTQEVMAAASTAKPTESKITSVGTSVVSGTNTVSLTWNKAENTTNYRIYYKEAGGSWELMKSLGSAKTAATLTSSSAHPIKTGVTYYFTVRTYNKNSGKYGLWDKTGTKVCFEAAAPGRSDITNAVASVKSGVNTVDLTWSRAENITNYKIYYKEIGGSWKRMKTLDSSKTSASFKSSSTTPFNSGESYMFTVRTYNSSTQKWGGWNKTGTKVTFPANTEDKYVKATRVRLLGTNNTSGGARGLREDNGIFKLNAEVLPTNATDRTINWTSSNTAVATVSSDGTVKMLKNGKTRITAKANGGDVSAVYDLEVVDEELIAQNIFEITNQERLKNGSEPLIYSNLLHDFSMTRAKELSIKYSHERPDGTRSGYGENIAKSFGIGGDGSEIVEAWMNSMGHRATLLGAYRALGVGVYIEDNNMYFVQNFCFDDPDQTYTLTLDCNGGTGPSSIEVSQRKKIFQEDLPIPQRPGYIFKGWALYDTVFKSMIVTHDYTLTAVWEPAN